MDFKIAVLAGDGIGPEISVQGVNVMTAVCEKFGHKVSYEYAICGADAIDKVGARSLIMTLRQRCVPSKACWRCARS